METVSIRLTLTQLRLIAEALEKQAAEKEESSELSEALMALYRRRMEEAACADRSETEEKLSQLIKELFG